MVIGYIVVNTDGKCLDRNMRWRRRETLRDAFVHKQDSLVEGGAWASVAKVVYAAEYDPQTDFARIVGAAMPFTNFMVSAVMQATAGQQ